MVAVLPHRRRGAAVHRAAARRRTCARAWTPSSRAWWWPTSATPTPSASAGFAGPRAACSRRAPVRRGRRRRPPTWRPRTPPSIVVHLRHVRRAEADPPRPALPRRPARAGRALVRRARRATCAGARRRAAGRSRRATRSSPRGCAAPPRCSTTPASIPRSGSTLLEREGVDVLCMAPTEYRAIAKRARLRPLPALRHAVAAGEPLNPEVVRPVERGGRRVEVHDGYGQTETGALTGMPIGPPVRPGSMGRPLPGFRLWIDDGELCVDPATVPDLLPRRPARPAVAHRRPRARGRRRLPLVRGPHRRRDHLGRLPDRAVRGGVGAVSHPAVAEAAAVAAPDEVRGQVVRAVVVLQRRATSRRRAGARAPGPRQGARPRPTSTRASWSSPRRCRRRRAARSSEPSSGVEARAPPASGGRS